MTLINHFISTTLHRNRRTSSDRGFLAILEKRLSFDGAVHVIAHLVEVCWQFFWPTNDTMSRAQPNS